MERGAVGWGEARVTSGWRGQVPAGPTPCVGGASRGVCGASRRVCGARGRGPRRAVCAGARRSSAELVVAVGFCRRGSVWGRRGSRESGRGPRGRVEADERGAASGPLRLLFPVGALSTVNAERERKRRKCRVSGRGRACCGVSILITAEAARTWPRGRSDRLRRAPRIRQVRWDQVLRLACPARRPQPAAASCAVLGVAPVPKAPNAYLKCECPTLAGGCLNSEVP